MGEEFKLPDGDWTELQLYWIKGIGLITEREWREMMYRVKETPAGLGEGEGGEG